MKINREKALAAFQKYTDRYDSSRDMIRLKIEHTYRVCGLCQQIARSLDLPEEEVDIAWLTGLLHDVGRFEQQRVYGTFTDADSIDHAKYGARILFGKVWEEKHGLASGSEESLSEEIQADAGISIRDFVEDASCDELLWTAVFYHSAYRIPEGLDERTAMFCHILRLSRVLRRCLILQASCFCITIVHLIDNIILHMLSIKCYCLVCAGGICDIQNENSLFVTENLTNNGILRHP